jgi:hypothetical protein
MHPGVLVTKLKNTQPSIKPKIQQLKGHPKLRKLGFSFCGSRWPLGYIRAAAISTQHRSHHPKPVAVIGNTSFAQRSALTGQTATHMGS